MNCAVCQAPIPDDAKFCSQCGSLVPRIAPPAKSGGPSVPCTNCATKNRAGAQFCQGCGKQMPAFASEAVQAAAAAKTAATSSSGRQPMSPSERSAFVLRLAGNAERVKALALAPVTGNSLRDVGAAIDRAREIESLWTRLDDEARAARAELGRWPDNAAVAEVMQLEADAERAWQARQAAVAQASLLERRYAGCGPFDGGAERVADIGHSIVARRDRRPNVSDRRQ